MATEMVDVRELDVPDAVPDVPDAPPQEFLHIQYVDGRAVQVIRPVALSWHGVVRVLMDALLMARNTEEQAISEYVTTLGALSEERQQAQSSPTPPKSNWRRILH